jgi:hypothetical protein
MTDQPYKMHRAPIRPDRVRRIHGGFAFIPSRFLHDGFFASLTQSQRSLYLFLVLAADRAGVSFYGYERICSALEVSLDEYLIARAGLIEMDLIAFDGTRFQVLSLPERPVIRSEPPMATPGDLEQHDPATIHAILRDALDRDR